jgi:hypothetical protein
VVVHVGFAAVFVGRVLMWLMAVGQGRMVVLVLVAGGQMCPVLAAAEVVGHVGMFVVVDLRIVAVLLTHGHASSVTDEPSAQRSVESVSSPLSLVLLSLLESEERCRRRVRGIGVVAGIAVAHGRASLGTDPD